MLASRTSRIWLVAVALLMLASVDWWWWELDARVGGWLPLWIVWSMGLQLVLAYALYRLGAEEVE